MATDHMPNRMGSDVLALPLGSCQGHLLEVECDPSCPSPARRIHRVEALAARYPAATVGDVARHLTCGLCRRTPRSITLVEIIAAHRVPLRNTGAA